MWITLVIVVIVVAGGIWFFKYRGNSSPASNTAQNSSQVSNTVSAASLTYKVGSNAIGNTISLVGVVDADSRSVLPNVQGRITNVYVQAGEEVTTGQKIAKVNPLQYQLQYQEALNNYNNAVANQPPAVVKQYELALEVAKQNLDNTIIVSPGNGVINSLLIATNDYVNQSNVATIVNNTSMWINASIDEIDMANVKKGQKVSITFSQLNNLRLTGTVSYLNPTAIQSGGLTTIPIKISFDKDPRSYGIIPGLDCNVELAMPTVAGAVSIPENALYRDTSGKDYVLLKTSTGTTKIFVAVQKRSGYMVDVKGDVKDGDVLILKIQSASTQQGNNNRRGPLF